MLKLGDQVVLRRELTSHQKSLLIENGADIPEVNKRYRVIAVSATGNTVHIRDLHHGSSVGWKRRNWIKVEPRYSSVLTAELALKQNYFDEAYREIQKEHLKIFTTKAKF